MNFIFSNSISFIQLRHLSDIYEREIKTTVKNYKPTQTRHSMYFITSKVN